MDRCKPWQSVVTRLITCLVLGGVAISAGLSVLEYQRSAADLRMHLSHRIALTTHDLQGVLRGLLDEPEPQQLTDALRVFTADQPIDAARLVGPDIEPITLGAWPGPFADDQQVHQWSLAEHAGAVSDDIALDRPTLVQAPFTRDRQRYKLELRVDGPAARAQIQHQIVERMAMQWLLLAVMLLLALFLVRRWFTSPLKDVIELIDQQSGPEPFRRLSRRYRGEFGQLAGAMADMLGRIESAAAQLADRERAFQSLYDLAPTAMLSLDPTGRIIQANRRAAAMFLADTAEALIGREAHTLVSEHDRPRLHETIDRLDVDETTQCELQLNVSGRTIHAALEAAALRNEEGTLSAVRLSLLDVSDWRRLRRQLEHQTRLLNLVIDHMSDGIVLVDEHQRVAAFNRRLADLLQRHPEMLDGAPYDPEQFWEPLGAVDRAAFLERIRHIEAESHRAVQERLETHKGVFQFQSMVLQDATQSVVGRLWVVRETTPQEQNRRLLRQQHQQLGALKQVSTALAQSQSVDAVLTCAADQLHILLGVEAVGLILRNRQSDRRCRQLIHRGSATLLLEPHRELAHALERQLVPLVMHNDDVAFWPDLNHDTGWGRAMEAAGLTCLAAGPLRGPHETVGIVWVAQRGGEGLESHHLHMLETLIPTIAARVHLVELEQQLQTLALTDGETTLPGQACLERALAQMTRNHDQLTVLVLELDHYEPTTQRYQPLTDANGLGAVVERLRGAMRRSTFLARLGPGQLGLVAPEVGPQTVEQLAQRLSAALDDPPLRLEDGRCLVVASSVGTACQTTRATPPAALLELARSRAELARRSGRTAVHGDEPECASARVG